jgi:hypothetical protein
VAYRPVSSKDLETDSETTAVAMQQHGKKVSVATVTHATRETESYPRGPRRGILKKRVVGRQYSTGILKEKPERGKLKNLQC